MTNQDYTHLLVVLDRSGSMASIRDDMENGLNELFKEQAKLPGQCLVDLAQFDDRYEMVFADKDVSKARAVLQPRGLTALLDAIGKSVVSLGEKLAGIDEDERPGTVLVVIVTDGMENASHDWNVERVRELITEQQDKWNWKFTFLGANIDAVKTAGAFGISKGDTLTYAATAAGTKNMNTSLNTYVTQTRSGIVAGYSDEDRKNATAD